MFIVTGISHAIILLLLCLWSCPTSSFVSRSSSPSPQSAEKQNKHAKLESSLSSRRNHLLLFAPSDDDGPVSAAAPLSHAGIEWRLRPPEGTSRMERFKVKLGASALRLEGKLRRRELPPVLCPKGGRALLEAYYKEPGRRKKKIARFGFTTSRGPSHPDIDTTIRETYGIDPPPMSATIAAVIYMFVEPEYRGRDVGTLALEVMSAIQSVQAVDFTVLVADDDGSGKLVRWYEDRGFTRAPLMQNVLGSPGGVNGVAMIAPVRIEAGFFDKCAVKWW